MTNAVGLVEGEAVHAPSPLPEEPSRGTHDSICRGGLERSDRNNESDRNKAFAAAKAFVNQTQLLGADEEQHEREQHQRLDEGEADEKCQLDARTRSRIAGQGFCH